jgi:hypothetical protein
METSKRETSKRYMLTGVVYKGDGTNVYLMMSTSPHRMSTVLGDVTGRRRRVDCHSCDGRADGNMLLSPVALASGRDGALYVGDYNFIRRLSPGREDVSSILQLTLVQSAVGDCF